MKFSRSMHCHKCDTLSEWMMSPGYSTVLTDEPITSLMHTGILSFLCELVSEKTMPALN